MKKGFAGALLLGLVVVGVGGWTLSNMLTANAVKSSLLINNDILRVRHLVQNTPVLREDNLVEKKDDKFYSWKGMSWAGEMVSLITMSFGRDESTFNLTNRDYMFYRSNEKRINNLLQKVQENGNKVLNSGLGKIYVPAWRSEGCAVIVPSIKGQFSLEYLSPSVLVFPEGEEEARKAWKQLSKGFVAPRSPLTAFDLAW